MKPEKFHATDYTPSEVEAAKRVMIEVAQNLGEYADACVVVGGWVPELLLPEAEPKHTGSIDVDLALNPERLSGERYASLLDTLKRKGHQPGEKPFQLFKEVKVGRETVRVDVEFLAPKGAKMKKNRPKRVPGFRVLEAEGCALAFDDPALVTIEGKMPDERPNRVSIRVASVADFLVMKGYALAGRDKSKDEQALRGNWKVRGRRSRTKSCGVWLGLKTRNSIFNTHPSRPMALNDHALLKRWPRRSGRSCPKPMAALPEVILGRSRRSGERRRPPCAGQTLDC